MAGHAAQSEVLIKLDAGKARADYQDALNALLSYRAEQLRRKAALNAVQTDSTASLRRDTAQYEEIGSSAIGRLLRFDF